MAVVSFFETEDDGSTYVFPITTVDYAPIIGDDIYCTKDGNAHYMRISKCHWTNNSGVGTPNYHCIPKNPL